MNVKSVFTIDKVLKISLLCFLSMAVIALVKSMAMPNDHLIKKQAHLALRAIGDELLTHAHDLSSPVQPLQEIDEHTLRLSFNNPIPINPDSLSLLAVKFIPSEIAPRAIVNVLESKSGELVYGFEINHLAPKEIPCLGRNLPKSDYYVDVSFYEHKPILLGFNAFTFGIIGIAFVSFALLRISFTKENLSKTPEHTTTQAKGITLDLTTSQILLKDKEIKLTHKEAQVFGILLKNEGQLVSREYLTQEVWLKEGVVTGRSLDMYISRLRKKLKDLPHAEILNQHGKGYILKV